MSSYFFLSWSLWFMLIIKWLSRRVFRIATVSLFSFVGAVFLIFLSFIGYVENISHFWYVSRIRTHKNFFFMFCFFDVASLFFGRVNFAEFACEYGILAFDSKKAKKCFQNEFTKFALFLSISRQNNKLCCVYEFQNKKTKQPS